MNPCDVGGFHIDGDWQEPEWLERQNGRDLVQRRTCIQCGRVQFREVTILAKGQP